MASPSQSRGARYEKWLQDPSSCQIEPSTLTLEDLAEDRRWKVVNPSLPNWRDLSEAGLVSLDAAYQYIALQFDLPVGNVYRYIEVHGDTSLAFSSATNLYEFIVGPRCIFALNSCRHDGPHWSEIAMAVYRYFQRKDLEWVFRVNVVNEETNQVVRDELYTEHEHLLWPVTTPQAWLYGTQEFTAVLGTPNVHGVAALVLGSYPNGNKTIREVYTWASPIGNWLHMAIHITNVEKPADSES